MANKSAERRVEIDRETAAMIDSLAFPLLQHAVDLVLSDEVRLSLLNEMPVGDLKVRRSGCSAKEETVYVNRDTLEMWVRGGWRAEIVYKD